MPIDQIEVLDHGFVRLLNIAGPNSEGVDDIDPSQVARISFDNFDKERTREQDEKLYEYLVANGHNTPVEMIETWWHMQLPIFVARQIVRHRTATINEVSARYAVLPNTWYIPDVKNVGVKGGSNKQGRVVNWDTMSPTERDIAYQFTLALSNQCKQSYQKYEDFLWAGVAPELARCFLHVNHYTHWVYKMDLHNLMHFMSLRCDAHAQWEAQQYGNAVYTVLKQYLPKSMELFDTYRRKATPAELVQLRDALAVLEHYQTSMDNPAEGMETVRKFFKRLGVK